MLADTAANIESYKKRQETRTEVIATYKRNSEREISAKEVTIWTERGSSYGGKLLAGSNILKNCLVKTGEMLVAFFEHCLYAIRLHLETHSLTQTDELFLGPNRLLHTQRRKRERAALTEEMKVFSSFDRNL